jgi:hypothetical protein
MYQNKYTHTQLAHKTLWINKLTASDLVTVQIQHSREVYWISFSRQYI